MIARSWRATVGDAKGYVRHFRRKVLPRLRQFRGFVGVLLLRRRSGNLAEIEVLTFWSSMRSIRQFAGEPANAAVVDEQATSLLRTFDKRARHFNVVLEIASRKIGHRSRIRIRNSGIFHQSKVPADSLFEAIRHKGTRIHKTEGNGIGRRSQKRTGGIRV